MIEFRDVSKVFAASEVISGFSLIVPSRQITVLMGLSGSGKTTLLQMVNRMVSPTSGAITIDGQDVSGLDPVKLRRSIGYVMQEVGLLPHKTILENVELIALISGQSKQEALANSTEMLHLVGLTSNLKVVVAGFALPWAGRLQSRVGEKLFVHAVHWEVLVALNLDGFVRFCNHMTIPFSLVHF